MWGTVGARCPSRSLRAIVSMSMAAASGSLCSQKLERDRLAAQLRGDAFAFELQHGVDVGAPILLGPRQVEERPHLELTGVVLCSHAVRFDPCGHAPAARDNPTAPDACLLGCRRRAVVHGPPALLAIVETLHLPTTSVDPSIGIVLAVAGELIKWLDANHKL